MISSCRLLPVLLLLVSVRHVFARGGPCRFQGVEALLVEPAKAANLSTTHYTATLRVDVSFASNANEEERNSLDLGSSLRIWTSDGNYASGSNLTSRTLLPFEHFEQEQDGNGWLTIIVKTVVPLEVPAVQMTIEKDSSEDYCGGSLPVLLDKQQCIDVVSATGTLVPVRSKDTAVSSTTKSENDTPDFVEFSMTINLFPTDTKLARTNVRLPPTDDIELQLYAYDLDPQNFTFWPEEATADASHRLTFYGSVKIRSMYLFDGAGVQLSAIDTSTTVGDNTRTCGESFYARIEEDKESNQDNCPQPTNDCNKCEKVYGNVVPPSSDNIVRTVASGAAQIRLSLAAVAFPFFLAVF